MSRTDVHRPYQVQTNDPYNRHRTYRFQSWSDREPDRILTYNSCGCNLCVGQLQRKYLRRQERGAWRKVRQALIKTPAADREDMDWHAPVSQGW